MPSHGRESFDAAAFESFEASGWEEKSLGYAEFVGLITTQMSEPLLDAAGVTAGSRVLDVGTGPGHIAAAAARRGAAVIGIDVADAMVTLARGLHRTLDFRRADAHALPFKDGSFDAVLGNFVILHLGRPERAAEEFSRVLTPGGRVALTTWDLSQAARFPGILVDAVAAANVASPVHVPAGPDFFHFALDGEFEKLFQDSGLDDCRVQTLAFPLLVKTANEVWDGLLDGTVRASALISGQSHENRQLIRKIFDSLVDEYRRGDGFELPVSVKLAVASKAI